MAAVDIWTMRWRAYRRRRVHNRLALRAPPKPGRSRLIPELEKTRICLTTLRGATRTHQDVTAEQAAGSSVQGRFAASPPGIGLMTGQGAATVN